MPIRDTAKRVDLPVWRSLLYVPVNVPKYVDKAPHGVRMPFNSTLKTVFQTRKRPRREKWSKRSLKWFLRRVQM